MDSPYRFLFAAVFAIGAVGFFSVLWVQPAYYAFISRRLAVAARTLSCLIGCGYLVAAYLVVHDAGSLGAVGVIAVCAFLNLFVLAVERPWLRRSQPTTTQRD
jgi:hypothetical protein